MEEEAMTMMNNLWIHPMTMKRISLFLLFISHQQMTLEQPPKEVNLERPHQHCDLNQLAKPRNMSAIVSSLRVTKSRRRSRRKRRQRLFNLQHEGRIGESPSPPRSWTLLDQTSFLWGDKWMMTLTLRLRMVSVVDSSLCHPSSPLSPSLLLSLSTGDTTMDLDTSGYSPSSKEYVDTSFLRATKRGVYQSDDDLSPVDRDDDDEEDEREEGTGGVRRSRRQTKGKRFQFWKNERPVYVKGKMMGLLVTNPTPAKPKRKHRVGGVGTGAGGGTTSGTQNKKSRNERKEIVKKLESDSEEEDKEIPPPVIPKQYKYLSRWVDSL
jgi:hypothetical protein